MNYIVLKIDEKINKVIEYFKPNKNDPHEGMKIFQDIFYSQYMYVSESANDYISGKRLIKKKLILSILQLCTWIFLMKSLFISYYNNRTLLIMTGDFTYLHPRPDILNITAFSIFLPIAIVGENNLLIIIYVSLQKYNI